YLIDGFSKWINGWKRKGWRTASGSPVLNRDLWEALDAARVQGLPLTYVKGHSGDPDNDRCDAIAVAFSKGQIPKLAQGEYGGLMVSESAAPAPVDLAPQGLQQLLSRLELADRLAQGGYGLSLLELAQLVEMPLKTLEAREGPWQWRDWEVTPAGDGRWQLRREASGSGQVQAEERQDG
ncbi:MAG: RNase H family protein, partial [Vulcanococcus sp.]